MLPFIEKLLENEADPMLSYFHVRVIGIILGDLCILLRRGQLCCAATESLSKMYTLDDQMMNRQQHAMFV